MSFVSKLSAILVAGTGVAVIPCLPCGTGIPQVRAQEVAATSQATDTATVRLHISRMTCGTCPATARLALKRLQGVYSASVTFDDSLGVVRYDPRKVTRAQIAAHLTRLTGFGATILPDTTNSSKRPGSA
jgi:mercuric ion binding protein